MQNFDLHAEYDSVISNSNIINLISKIHEYKGEQPYLLETQKDTLESLTDIAKIESTSSSNKIEGIYTTDKRINEIVIKNLEPKNRNEEEIAGYRDVLTLIHENYKYIDINQNTILQLHRDLYKYTGYSYGGKFKNSQNYIEETNVKGEKKIRFTPLNAVETPIAVTELCQNYNAIVNDESCDLLILIPIFILDFVSIHPFNDGNGRMSRLLTLLLLYRTNYMVGKYISIEKMIEETKDSYYEALEKSSIGWHDNKNDYSYFVEYYLGVILSAYKEFAFRINTLKMKKSTAYDRISNLFKNNIIPLDKNYVSNKCPDISITTIERVLSKLVKENKIIKISMGRFTKYKWQNND